MTPYVLTLMGKNRTNPLEQDHIDRVSQNLSAISRTDWLAPNEALDIYFESDQSAFDLSNQARAAIAGSKIDAVCTPMAGRRKKLLISDMDSTIIHQECINELGDAIGVGDEIKAITHDVINGNITFSEALRARLALMKGMDFSVLEQVYDERITLIKGARTLIQTMRQNGAYCILVSGGFTFFTKRISRRLGFDDHQGNELTFEAGKLTGKVQDPILGRTAKLETLKTLCAEQGLAHSEVLAVGDGANDIKMIREAGLGVAFHGSDALKESANAWVDHGDLTALLYIQGFHKSEFLHP